MFYRVPEEFFFPVVIEDDLDFLDKEDKINCFHEDTGIKGVFEEADEEYLQSEIGE
ncbi:hypothetical protein [Clostridium sp. HBUAS56017]|uniref:hypothetical protein n=1 Tax=Clostridium sp. HBUAS56017 TaxID=2571128 RepID=UPI00163D94C9|nr:hypothetical protein [Clostridium sp. HBUAS56017]